MLTRVLMMMLMEQEYELYEDVNDAADNANDDNDWDKTDLRINWSCMRPPHPTQVLHQSPEQKVLHDCVHLSKHLKGRSRVLVCQSSSFPSTSHGLGGRRARMTKSNRILVLLAPAGAFGASIDPESSST